ncbi:MAG: hypothetical protein H0W43_09680 [Chthoniobacterales bacterium]|nr:hypothetical protein [Chthoniobacterales bacterium]
MSFFRPAYLPSNRIRILGAAGTRARLQNALVGQMDPLQFPVPFEALAGISGIEEFGVAPTTLGNFHVGTIALNHPGGCTGFRVSAGEETVAYLPDHESYQVALVPPIERLRRPRNGRSPP